MNLGKPVNPYEGNPVKEYADENPDWIEKEEGINLKPQNVMYWEPTSKSLMRISSLGDKTAATMLTKAKKFIESHCIIEQNDGYICLPLEGYNKTTYTIKNGACNCQGWSSKQAEGQGFCSHVLAVRQYEYLKKNG